MTTPSPLTPCQTCGSFLSEEYAMQKLAYPQDNTYLPNGTSKLKFVKDLDPHGGREKHLLQCPECGAYYLYRTDYTYLVGGHTEDEEFLTRLTLAEAQAYLK